MALIVPEGFQLVSNLITKPNSRFIAEALGRNAERLVNPNVDMLRAQLASNPATREALGQVDRLARYLRYGEEALPYTTIAEGRLSPVGLEFLETISAPQVPGDDYLFVSLPDRVKDINNLALLRRGNLQRIASYMDRTPDVSSVASREYMQKMQSNPFSPWNYNRYNDPEVEGLMQLVNGFTTYPRIGRDSNPLSARYLPYGDVPGLAQAFKEMSLRSMLKQGYELDEPIMALRTQNFMKGRPGRTGGTLSFTNDPDMVYDMNPIEYELTPRSIVFSPDDTFHYNLGESEIQALAEAARRVPNGGYR